MVKSQLDSLRGAYERRLPFLQTQKQLGTSAFQLFSGKHDGIPGLIVELLGSHLVIHAYCEATLSLRQNLINYCHWLSDHTLLHSAVIKKFIKDRSQTLFHTESHLENLLGTPIANEFTIEEHHHPFLIKSQQGFSTGLFLDQRMNRHFLSTLKSSGTALNLFCYTAGFSIYLAKKGLRTVNVDISKPYLSWAKQNFLLNQLDLTQHQFWMADANTWLGRSQKRNERYDIVIVDPPIFSRSKEGALFKLERDFPKLINDSKERVAKDGYLFFSNNYQSWTLEMSYKVVRLFPTNEWTQEILPEPSFDIKQTERPIRAFLFKRK